MTRPETGCIAFSNPARLLTRVSRQEEQELIGTIFFGGQTILCIFILAMDQVGIRTMLGAISPSLHPAIQSGFTTTTL